MLYVKFGTLDVDENTPSAYIELPNNIFDNYYDVGWLKGDEFAERIIKEIDQCDVLDTHLMKSPKLGLISPDWLAAGTKNLILVKRYYGIIIDGDKLVDNCWPYLLELSLTEDIQITLFYCPIFDWIEGAKIVSISSGEIMTNFKNFAVKHLLSEDVHSHFKFEDVDWPISVDKDIFKINLEEFD